MAIEALEGQQYIGNELIEAAALEVVDKFVVKTYFGTNLTIDTQGLSSDVVRQTLEKLSEESKDGQYVARGRQLQFWPVNLAVDDNGPTTKQVLMEAILSSDERMKYVRDLIGSRKPAHWLELPRNPTDEDILSYFYDYYRDPQLVGMKVLSGFNITEFRRILNILGNPGDKDTADLPLLIPVFNIEATHVPENAVEMLTDYTRRFYKAADNKGYVDEERLTELFTSEELEFAERSKKIVTSCDAMTMRSMRVSPTYTIMTAPMYPYEAIRKNYGYYYEGWLGFGPNDELWDEYEKTLGIDFGEDM